MQFAKEQDNHHGYCWSIRRDEATARLAAQSASSLGWERLTGRDGAIIAIDRFDASAREETLFVPLGLTVEHSQRCDIARWKGTTRCAWRILSLRALAVPNILDALSNACIESARTKSKHRREVGMRLCLERLAKRTIPFSYVPKRGFRAVGLAHAKCPGYARVRQVTGFCRNLP